MAAPIVSAIPKATITKDAAKYGEAARHNVAAPAFRVYSNSGTKENELKIEKTATIVTTAMT
jgi:hypothetical protein